MVDPLRDCLNVAVGANQAACGKSENEDGLGIHLEKSSKEET